LLSIYADVPYITINRILQHENSFNDIQIDMFKQLLPYLSDKQKITVLSNHINNIEPLVSIICKTIKNKKNLDKFFVKIFDNRNNEAIHKLSKYVSKDLLKKYNIVIHDDRNIDTTYPEYLV
jgi:hypothetical protein